MANVFANSGDSDQVLHSVVSVLGLYFLSITLLGSPDSNGLKYEPSIITLTTSIFSCITV